MCILKHYHAVFCAWNTNYKQKLEWAKLPTLMNCRLQDIATIMYKVKFKLAPSYIQDLFSTNHIVYNLRVKEFAIPRFNSIHYGKHSLRYLGPVLWAKLPSCIGLQRMILSYVFLFLFLFFFC